MLMMGTGTDMCQKDPLVLFNVPADLQAGVQKLYQAVCDIDFEVLVKNELSGFVNTKMMVSIENSCVL